MGFEENWVYDAHGAPPKGFNVLLIAAPRLKCSFTLGPLTLDLGELPILTLLHVGQVKGVIKVIDGVRTSQFALYGYFRKYRPNHVPNSHLGHS